MPYESNYRVLNALPAEAFLRPEDFVTGYDVHLRREGYDRKQYEKGLNYSRQAASVIISINCTWAANLRDGSSVASYEGIGYHACTADLLRGFLDGPARVVVYRWTGKEVRETVIKQEANRIAG